MEGIFEIHAEKVCVTRQLKKEIDQFILHQHFKSDPKTSWKTPFKILYIYTLFPYIEPEKYKLFKYTKSVIRNNCNSKTNAPCRVL